MTQQRNRKTDRGRSRTTAKHYSRDDIIYLAGSEDLHDREIRSQNNKNNKKQSKKHKKNRRNVSGKVFLYLFIIIIICAGLVYLETLIFQLKQIRVTGNVYTTQQEVEEWVKQNPYSGNTLYDLWYFNRENCTQLPSVEKVKVSLISPRKINVAVTEKTMTGRIDLGSGYLYFDKDGIASLKSEELIEGTAMIEGIQIEESKVKLGKKIPVDDKDVFKQLSELIALLQENELTADKIICSTISIPFCIV